MAFQLWQRISEPILLPCAREHGHISELRDDGGRMCCFKIAKEGWEKNLMSRKEMPFQRPDNKITVMPGQDQILKTFLSHFLSCRWQIWKQLPSTNIFLLSLHEHCFQGLVTIASFSEVSVTLTLKHRRRPWARQKKPAGFQLFVGLHDRETCHVIQDRPKLLLRWKRTSFVTIRKWTLLGSTQDYCFHNVLWFISRKSAAFSKVLWLQDLARQTAESKIWFVWNKQPDVRVQANNWSRWQQKVLFSEKKKDVSIGSTFCLQIFGEQHKTKSKK